VAGKPEGYIDVSERIIEFRGKYPEGSLAQVSLEFLRDFGGKDWVVYTAAAYRGPEDVLPGVGTAWEPVPGPTAFTRDSEVQNAETAAWGRAMVAALAVDTNKGIASKQEVLARSSAPLPIPVPEVPAEVVADWVDAINDTDSLKALQTVWEQAGAAGVARNGRVLAAKDDRKKALA
jgi:hypothetical protein